MAKKIRQKILKLLISFILIIGGLIIFKETKRGDIYYYLAVILVFISLTSIWFIFSDRLIKNLQKLGKQKYPLLYEILRITFWIIVAWLSIVCIFLLTKVGYNLARDKYYDKAEQAYQYCFNKTVNDVDLYSQWEQMEYWRNRGVKSKNDLGEEYDTLDPKLRADFYIFLRKQFKGRKFSNWELYWVDWVLAENAEFCEEFDISLIKSYLDYKFDNLDKY